MTRAGDLSSADLGNVAVSPYPNARFAGELRSITHFDVDGERWTNVLVRNGASYHSFRCPADTEVEVTER